jgi:hypothetical protein
VKKTDFLTGAAIAVLLVAGSATAAGAVQYGTLAAGYGFGINKGLSDMYGFNGTLSLPLSEGGSAEHTGIELLGGYHRPETGGSDIGDLGGAFYAGGELGRIAVNGTWHRFNSLDIETFGAGGELYLAPDLTLGLRGGGVVWEHNNGGYAGVQGTYYPTPGFALSGTFDYWSAGYNQASETLMAEWQPVASLPFGLYTGYQHWDSHGLSDSMIFTGVRFYFGGSGETLAGRQRGQAGGFLSRSPLNDGLY